MAIVVRLNGCVRLAVQHVIQKLGVYWYQRRIPRDMQDAYPPPHRFIRRSLRTRDPKAAAASAITMAAQDDAFWASRRKGSQEASSQLTASALGLLRSIGLVQGEAVSKSQSTGEEIRSSEAFDHFDAHMRKVSPDYRDARALMARDEAYGWEYVESEMALVPREALKLLHEVPLDQAALPITLSAVLEKYLARHDKGDLPKFRKDVTRAVEVVIAKVGDLPIASYTRDHAENVVESLSENGRKTATVRRRLTCIVAVFNFAIEQLHIEFRNSFAKFKIKKEGGDKAERRPFDLMELETIAPAARAKDDDIRHLNAILFDTGARLAEIVGLRRSDIVLSGQAPHILIREDLSVGRTLKNKDSARVIPLVGEALWGTQQAVANATGDWLFSRYAADNDIRATAASQILNKWLRSLPGVNKTVHSYRHSMRDRMREARIPEPEQERLGGWGSRTVGQRYGAGYAIEHLHLEMKKVERMW